MFLMLKAAASHDTNVLSAFPADVHMAQSFAALAEGGVELSRLIPPGDKGRRRPAGADWFIQALDNLPACVYMTDAQGVVTYANRIASRLVGREPALGRDRFTIAHRLFTMDGLPVADDASPMAITLRDAVPIRGVEMLLERPDGTRIPVMPLPTPLFDVDGRLCGSFTLLIDISARKQAEQRLAESYRRDSLTGLPNRTALSAYLDECIVKAESGGENFVAMRLDLDAFKALNDEYGHGVGDTVLVEAAGRLRCALGDAFLAHVGSDEFMVVSRSAQAGVEAHLLARQVRSAFDAKFLCGDDAFSISVSTGCARYPQDGDDETRLVAAANAALKLAKMQGPGTMRMFDIAEQAREHERQSFRKDLREAIEANAITPHFQPLFRPDGSIAGFEALARWDHGVRGLVAPAAFIAAAEEEGELIAALDAYILRSACIEAARWTQPLRIAVNVSALEFQSGDLPARVEAVLAETGLDPERLELEITEGVMVTDADRAMATFAQLRALGVRIALDDFGTGYSSLSYLHRFPLTTLKIDRSFIAKLGVTLESVAITRAVIQLGHALGIEVVAEGVETPEQLDFLIQEGCDLTQGYLLGRPKKASDYAHVTGA